MALSKAGLVDVTAITGETALASAPAATDELLISDAGTLKRIDFSLTEDTVRHAKCWCKWESIGTPAIEGSFNAASITDNGTGDTTINFTTNLGDTHYAVATSSVTQSNNNGKSDNLTDTAVDSFRLVYFENGSATDARYRAIVFGN
jgi:hypothetical protein|tara:strand:+ start:31 stop:471 length:441 start_codon:yes stop_codon:yes gene_type:complete